MPGWGSFCEMKFAHIPGFGHRGNQGKKRAASLLPGLLCGHLHQCERRCEPLPLHSACVSHSLCTGVSEGKGDAAFKALCQHVMGSVPRPAWMPREGVTSAP